MKRLFACLILAVCAAPAAACVNDRELPAHEREFRSSYGKQAAPPSAPAPSSSGWLLGSGAGLLAGAAVLAFTARKK